jgi:hypothetical protein
VFADVLPKLFGQFGPGEWVFADHCGQCGVGLHGFTKGVFWGGGFLRGRHRAIRTRRAWLPSEKSTGAVDHLRNQGRHRASGDLAHLSPLGWEHINLTGDYHWDTSPTLGPDEFRPLRTHAHDFAAAA